MQRGGRSGERGPVARWCRVGAALCVGGALWALTVLPALDYRRPGAPALASDGARTMPYALWRYRHEHAALFARTSCGRAPLPADLVLAGALWQRAAPAAHVYSAHWDHRPRRDRPLLRLLLSADDVPLTHLYCQIWYRGSGEPHVVRAAPAYSWRPSAPPPPAGLNAPYVVACALPDARAPLAVSLAPQPCALATNALAVQGEEGAGGAGGARRARGVAVCARWSPPPPPSADDAAASAAADAAEAARLAEWLQLLRHFGAHTVYIYYTPPLAGVGVACRSVLVYYAALGLVRATRVSPPPAPAGAAGAARGALLRRHCAAMPYNDCLYRALAHRHRWLTALDTHETVAPLRDQTWEALLSHEPPTTEALALETTWFPAPAQRDLADADAASFPLLSYEWRAPNVFSEEEQPRGFYSTAALVSMQEHGWGACGPAAPRACAERRADPARAVVRRTWSAGATGDGAASAGAACGALPPSLCAEVRARAFRDPALRPWRRVRKEVLHILRTLNITLF